MKTQEANDGSYDQENDDEAAATNDDSKVSLNRGVSLNLCIEHCILYGVASQPGAA